MWLSLEQGPSQTGGAELEHVFRARYPRLVSLLARLTGDRGQAEELASEVFCRLSARPALLRPDHNLDGWLYRTAVNLGLDALRTASRRRLNEQAAGAEASRRAGASDPLEDILRREKQQRVQAVLAGLRPAYARLLLLRHAGLSYSELAQALRLNPASVGKQLARAMTEFEKRYRSAYGSEG
jgi:RNA polymerase sigma factor (sigma-70 family)